ncbi:YcxB family protein [Lachnospiraceae bacterium 42-17]|jgi:hypothetical protein|nr:YcxB family protein [Dorea sp.]
MAFNYRVKYEESVETLEVVCELYDVDNSDLTMKYGAAGLGIMVLVFMFIYGNPGGGTAAGLLFFFIKYMTAWAALAFAAVIINRTVWRKAVRAAAVGDAEEMFKYRKQKNGKAIVSQIDFYENCFESVTKIKKRAFDYEDVVRILETERGLGLVVKTNKHTLGSVKAVIGFPKEALMDGDIEGLKEFLLGRCTKVKIKKL